MTRAAAGLARGRRAAEKLMVDECTISRVKRDEHDQPILVTDEDGGVTPARDGVYAGRCKVQALNPQESNPEVAGYTATIQRYRVDVPVPGTRAGYRPTIGDLITVTAASADPHLTGTRYRVVAVPNKSMSTAYRLDVTSEV